MTHRHECFKSIELNHVDLILIEQSHVVIDSQTADDFECMMIVRQKVLDTLIGAILAALAQNDHALVNSFLPPGPP